MKVFVFPGQASQFPGMGKDLYKNSEQARVLFEQANEILGFRITEIMFEGNAEDLQRTDVTQPAVFLHSVILALTDKENFQPAAVAGHSLGEFSALVAANAISFEDGLKLVQQRSEAMQRACELNPGTMAAIIGLPDEEVEKICEDIEAVVIAANYNCPGQLVISGSITGVEQAVDLCKEKGARMAVTLAVGGAFHSPLMQPAEESLMIAIRNTQVSTPSCKIYQNYNAQAETEPARIKENLIKQLTAPVQWTQIMKSMKNDGLTEVIEVGGNGKTLQAFFKRFDKSFVTSALVETK